MNASIAISGKTVDASSPVYIIAEMSANHLMDESRAYQIIDAAVDAGADAIKLQTYTPDTITLDCDSEYFQITQDTIWDGTTLHKLYEEAYTPWDWQPRLKAYADEAGIALFSSPFDLSSVSFLEDMDVSAYKIASFEITDIPLIEAVARLGKPVIISTGIARLEDIQRALEACRLAGNEQVALLKCTSAYPSPYEDINLRTIPNMAQTFGCLVGLSDHTMGHDVAVAAVALGARIVEKHLTLSRGDGGPDAAFSMEPQEFKAMVAGIRAVEKALGSVSYDLTAKQKKSREHSRSLFASSDIKCGERLNAENVRSVRPAFGIHPMHYEAVLGKVAKRDIPYGTPLSWEDIE